MFVPTGCGGACTPWAIMADLGEDIWAIAAPACGRLDKFHTAVLLSDLLAEMALVSTPALDALVTKKRHHAI